MRTESAAPPLAGISRDGEPATDLFSAVTAPPTSLDHPGPRAGRFLQLCGRLFLRLAGWRMGGEPPQVRKAVFIAAPHTSNWDTVFMLAVAWAYGMRLSFLMKHTMFRFPLRRFFKFLGGTPVIREKNSDTVQQVAQRFSDADTLFLAIAPDGTRSKKDGWRSGFYNIARAAGVPVICGYLDFRRKMGGCGPVIDLSGDVAADMEQIRAFYTSIRGRYPEKESRILLRVEDEAQAEAAVG